MKQSNLRKSIREPKGSRSAHRIGRDIIECIPEKLGKPVLVIDNPDKTGIAILIDEIDHKNRPVLVAIHLEKEIYGQAVNEVKSIYGREDIEGFLEREKNHIAYADKEKVKYLSPTIEKQYLKAPIKLDYKETIPQKGDYVKSENVKANSSLRGRSAIAQDIRKSGFTPTKGLINAIRKLDQITGRTNTMKDICSAYKSGCVHCGAEEKELINEIAQECKQQELAKMLLPER